MRNRQCWSDRLVASKDRQAQSKNKKRGKKNEDNLKFLTTYCNNLTRRAKEGKIDNIDVENSRLTVLIDLFGQETPVEVELLQVNVAK